MVMTAPKTSAKKTFYHSVHFVSSRRKKDLASKQDVLFFSSKTEKLLDAPPSMPRASLQHIVTVDAVHLRFPVATRCWYFRDFN